MRPIRFPGENPPLRSHQSASGLGTANPPTIKHVGSTATQPAARPHLLETPANPLALWHLLSLDAPTVAALWTWFLARAIGLRLPAVAVVAMFLAVWILYASDRLLDARVLDVPLDSGSHAVHLELRHLFHHRLRARFLLAIGLSGTLLALMLPRLDPAALRLYLTEGILLVAWFVLLHSTRIAERLVPKEVLVGIFFAAAVFIPAVARRPDLRGTLLPVAIAFAALCTLNCVFIHSWESTPEFGRRQTSAHPLIQLAARILPALAVTEVLGCALLAAWLAPSLRLTPIACGAAAALLLGLHLGRTRLERTTLRAAADVALLTPVLLVPFLR